MESRWARCLLALLAAVLTAGCSGSNVPSHIEKALRNVPADVDKGRRFMAFPLYWVGERFERWDLTVVDGLDYPSPIVTFIYGDCTPHGQEQPSCSPPLQIQVSSLCSHLAVVARAPIWKSRQIRGAPVGTIDGAPVLFTAGAQVKVYRGEGSDPRLPLRALHALRSLNRVPPLVRETGLIPAPSAAVLAGSAACTT
jgi:hypothetical protein